MPDVSFVPYISYEMALMPAKTPFSRQVSHGAPQVVAVDSGSVARHAWAAFLDCLYGKPPFKVAVSLQKIIGRHEGFPGQVPSNRLQAKTAKQFLAVRALWQRTVYKLEDDSLADPARRMWAAAKGSEARNPVPDETTKEMHRCVAPIVFVKPKATYRTCKTLVCPWCHLRRSLKILKDIPNKKDYAVTAYGKTINTNDFPANELEEFRHYTENIRRRCDACVRSIFVAPVKDGWHLYGAIFCKRDATPSGPKWHHPKSFAEILRWLNPYPTTYLLASGEELATLLNGMHGLAPVTKSRGVDYGLNPVKKDPGD